MDSFAKALGKGLAKTVAVGQQQLQQRLAKYDQQHNNHGNGNGNGAGNTYGTGQAAQAQYVYGGQGSYQTPPVVNQQHSPYYPPPPGTVQPQNLQQQQQKHQAYGHGQYSPAVTSLAPTQVYSPQVAPGGSFGHGYQQQQPPPPPTNDQQGPANTYYTAEYTQTAPYGYGNGHAGADGYGYVPPVGQQFAVSGVQTTNTYTAPPVSSPANYHHPPPLGVNQSAPVPVPVPVPVPGNSHYAPVDNSQAVPYGRPEHVAGTDPVQPPAPATQATYTDHHAAAHTATASPGPTEQQPATAHASTTTAALMPPVTSQTQPVTAAAVSPLAVQESQHMPANPEATRANNLPAAPTNQLMAPQRKPVPQSTPGPEPTQQYQPAPTQQSSPPVNHTTYNGYSSPEHVQPYNPATFQPPPETTQQPPSVSYPGIPTYVPSPAANTAQYQLPQVDPASIAQQMNNLSINNDPATQANNTRGAFLDAKAVKPKLPPVVASGTPRDVVRFCPEFRPVDYSLYWYQLPEATDFLICTRCHEDHIKDTPLAGHFHRILAEEGSVSTCHFWHPRVKDHLWKQALQRNNLDELHAYAVRRLAIPNCKGKQNTTSADGVKYVGMRNNDINGFIACEACHEDKILGTAFESNFTPYREQAAGETWMCDMSIAYLTRALGHFAKKNDWTAFVEGGTRRCQLPACDGRDKAATEGVWYVFRRKMDEFHACGTCYMDKFELTVFEDEFEAVDQNRGFDHWMEMLGVRWTCNMTDTSLPILFALDPAMNAEDFDGFWNAAQTLAKLVPCTANGIIRGNWWTVPGGCADFSICEACYIGIFKTNELDKFLEPAERSPEATIVCSFSTSTRRYKQFIGKFAEALDRSVFSYYIDYVRKFAPILPCPGIDHREKANWWGYPGALFCQDCFASFVADTPLGSHLDFNDAFDERAQICQIWSPRMRGMWKEACDAGAPGSDESNEQVDKFKAFSNKRLEVYLQTVPRIKFIKGMKEIKMMNAMHMGQLSLMYSGMNSMSAISGTGDGYLHGNSSLGYYETENGVTGAQMFNDMQSGFADANRTDEWAEVMRLSMMWTEVE